MVQCLVQAREDVRSIAASGRRRPNGRIESRAIFLRNVQDEAGMRVRSHEDSGDLFPRHSSRARSSKVQYHSLSIQVAGCQSKHVPTEMLALSRKTADVLGKAQIQATRPIFNASLSATAVGPTGPLSSIFATRSVWSWVVPTIAAW